MQSTIFALAFFSLTLPDRATVSISGDELKLGEKVYGRIRR
jgi:hypothetical protein